MSATPTVGRMVHFVLDQGPFRGEHRPAIIVAVFRSGDEYLCNLQVILDCNEHGYGNDSPATWEPPSQSPIYWATSRAHDHGHQYGTWHWPEKV